MNAELGRFKTPDGLDLYYEYWIPAEPRGVLLIVHGLGEHCGRYGAFVRYLTDRNYIVALYDHRGHGKSQGKRVFAESLEVLIDDLVQFVAAAQKKFPEQTFWTLLGQSLGGQIVLNYAANFSHPFVGVIACSPNLEIAAPLPAWKLKAADWLHKRKPTFRLREMFSPTWLSHDFKVVRSYIQDPLISRYVTVSLGQAILENLKKIPSLTQKIRTPILFLHGTADRICNPQATLRFYEELAFQEKEIRLYEGLYHELLNEVTCEKVYGDIEQWLEKRRQQFSASLAS